jgi:predicted DCC family thiol-disulfide oxidoreductase YuxK
VSRTAPLLVVYDAESARQRRWVDWIRRRDARALVVSFPFQNPELLGIAPELAGLPLHRQAHGLDTGSRKVYTGDALAGQAWRRLRGWGWLAWLSRLPGTVRLVSGILPIP